MSIDYVSNTYYACDTLLKYLNQTITGSNIGLITGIPTGALIFLVIVVLIIKSRSKSDKMEAFNEGTNLINENDENVEK